MARRHDVEWLEALGEPELEWWNVREVRRAVDELASCASEAALERLYALTRQRKLLGLVETDSELAATELVERRRLIGRMFVLEAPELEAVRLGISLLGDDLAAADRELLVRLATLEPLLNVVAGQLARAGCCDELVDLTHRLKGAQRTLAVQHLAEVDDPRVPGWLLRHGIRGDEEAQQLAFVCAVAGKLHVALTDEKADALLMRAAAEIFIALAYGTEVGDLADYENRHEAIAGWLEHLRRRGLDLHQLTALDALAGCEEVSPEALLEIDCLRHSYDARAVIHAGLQWPQQRLFERADLAACRREVPTFEAHEHRLLRDEGGIDSVLRLMDEVDASTIDRALVAVMPLVRRLAIARHDRVDTRDAGLALAAVTRELARYPGKGLDLLALALKAPDPRARRAALATLTAWPPSQLRALHSELQQLASSEPLEDLRREARSLLSS